MDHSPVTEKLSSTFCVLPWMHLHIWPDSQIFPCCAADNSLPIANYAGETAKEVFNFDRMKTLRKKMLAGEKCGECNRCYNQERNDPNNSQRIDSNKRYAQHIPVLLADTEADGTLQNPRMRFVDFRFSNLCNFKCRTCGPDLSSNWFEDHNKLMQRNGFPGRKEKIKEIEDLENLLSSNLEDISYIYFAGGEPLLMRQHLQLLEDIIEKADPKKVSLMYNSNLSVLKKGNADFVEIWKKFKSVELWVSADAAENVGEYIRKGFNWKRFVANLRRVRTEAPEIRVMVSATLSIFNALHLPDMHRIFVEEGLIETNYFRINMLFDPLPLRVDRMPRALRKAVVQLYIDHALTFFNDHHANPARDNFLSSARFINAGESTREQEVETRKFIAEMDDIRGEDVRTIIPNFDSYFEKNSDKPGDAKSPDSKLPSKFTGHFVEPRRSSFSTKKFISFFSSKNT